MGCSQCGAPLEFVEGHAMTCHYCGQVQAPPATHLPSDAYGSGAHTYGGVEGMPAHARSDFEGSSTFDTHSATPPPAYTPSAGGSVVGKIIVLAAVVLAAAVVLSIAASSSRAERHHPSSSHHRGR